MKVLVMGGTEFVSSAMAQYLIGKGYTVDIFTRGIKLVKYTGFRKQLTGDRKSLESLRVSIGDESYDYVFDISAYTREDVEKLTNVLNRDNLKRYVFCSSGAVYIPTEEPSAEDYTRGENINWGKYGTDKIEAEEYLFSLYEKEGFPITIFRPSYIYGEGNNLYREAFFFDRVLKGLDIPVPIGNARTQFVYIGDLVKTFEDCVHKEKTNGQAYNMTHPEIVNWEQLCNTVMDIIGGRVKVIEVDAKGQNLHERQFFPFRNVTYLLNMDKSKEDGLYLPEKDLKEGLKLALAWYISKKPHIVDKRMDKVDYVLEK